METASRLDRARFGFVVLSLCSVGCFGPHRDWTDNLVWSPDGSRAAVIASGFYLSDREGNLTALNAPDVYRVAWLGDSQRLVVARSRKVSSFAEIAAAVGPERTRSMTAEAQRLWLLLQAPDWEEYLENSATMMTQNAPALPIYLREHYAEELRARFPDVWKGIKDLTVDLHALVVARVANGCLEPVATLNEDVTPIKTIRPAPGDRAVAFVTENEELFADSTIRTYVVPTDGSTPATLVEEETGESIDWTPDGRSVMLLSESARDINIGRLGCLAKRDVVGADGAIVVDKNKGVHCLVDLIFEEGDRVRCLRDGRVLFDGFEMQLPKPSGTLYEIRRDSPGLTGTIRLSNNRQGVFAFDPVHKSDPPMFFLPEDQFVGDGFGFYEVSPDLTRVIYGTATGQLMIVSLSDGRTELLPLGLEKESVYIRRDLPLAAWSGPDAFTYLKRMGSRNEYILRRGNTEIVLSRNWPADMLWPPPKD